MEPSTGGRGPALGSEGVGALPRVHKCIMEGCERIFNRESTMLQHVQVSHFKQTTTIPYFQDERGVPKRASKPEAAAAAAAAAAGAASARAATAGSRGGRAARRGSSGSSSSSGSDGDRAPRRTQAHDSARPAKPRAAAPVKKRRRDSASTDGGSSDHDERSSGHSADDDGGEDEHDENEDDEESDNDGTDNDAAAGGDDTDDEAAQRRHAKRRQRRRRAAEARPRSQEYHLLRQAYDDEGLLPPVQWLLDDAARHQLLDPVALTLTFHGRIVGRRTVTDGGSAVLVRWTPEGLLDDEWLPSDAPLLARLQRTASIRELARREVVDVLHHKLRPRPVRAAAAAAVGAATNDVDPALGDPANRDGEAILSRAGTRAAGAAVAAASRCLEVLKTLHMRGHISLPRKVTVKRILLSMMSHPLRDECVLLLDQCRQTKFYYGTARALERLLLNHDLAICHDVVDALSVAVTSAEAAGAGDADRLDAATVKDVQKLINAGSGPLWMASDRPALHGGVPRARGAEITLADIRTRLEEGRYTSRQRCLEDIQLFLRSGAAAHGSAHV